MSAAISKRPTGITAGAPSARTAGRSCAHVSGAVGGGTAPADRLINGTPAPDGENARRTFVRTRCPGPAGGSDVSGKHGRGAVEEESP